VRPEKSHKEAGVLRTSIERGGRTGAALLLCGALLIVPLLLIQGDPQASASPPGTAPDHHGDPVPSRHPVPPWKLASDRRATTATTAARAEAAAGATTPTPTDPGTSAPPALEHAAATGEEVARRVSAVTTTTSPPPSTSTTTTTTSAPVVAVASGTVHYGQVTYYDHPAGTCASPWLPFGTVVEVTNPDNGYSASCVVNDREADTTRSIDLATSTFADIAPLSQGVIDAQLRW
jgi:rare lipoprotein A